MKTVSFITVFFAAFLCGACYADPPASAGDARNATDSLAARQNERPAKNGFAGEANSKPVSPAAESPNKASVVHNASGQILPGGMNFYQPARLGQVPGQGPAKIGSHPVLPAKLGGCVPLGGTTLTGARKPASGTVIVGGTANPVKSAAAINGTGMNRKH